MGEEESPALVLAEIPRESSALCQVPRRVEVLPVGPLVDIGTGLAQPGGLDDGTDGTQEDEEADKVGVGGIPRLPGRTAGLRPVAGVKVVPGSGLGVICPPATVVLVEPASLHLPRVHPRVPAHTGPLPADAVRVECVALRSVAEQGVGGHNLVEAFVLRRGRVGCAVRVIDLYELVVPSLDIRLARGAVDVEDFIRCGELVGRPGELFGRRGIEEGPRAPHTEDLPISDVEATGTL